MIIQEIKADLFEEIKKVDKNKTIVICHICNNINAWGSGFVIPLAKNFPESKSTYHNEDNFLGNIQTIILPKICAKPRHLIFNMIAQNGITKGSTGNPKYINTKPIRYEALVTCMVKVKSQIFSMMSQGYDVNNLVFCIPRFGSDKAGGNWEFIKELINEIWVDFPVYVYYI